MKDRRAAPATRLRRRRDPRSDAHGATGVPASPSARPAATAAGVTRPPARLDAPQDRALYTCGCGFVFRAAVSTSVGCPHCGDHQAW